MIPWSQTATTGDNPCDPNWYKTFIRALNERLNAIGAIPIAEDQTSYPPPSPNSVYPIPGATTIAGASANQIWPVNTQDIPFICQPCFRVKVTSVDSIPGVFLGISGTWVLDPDDTWGAEYGHFVSQTVSGSADSNLVNNGWVPLVGDTVLFKFPLTPIPPTSGYIYPLDYKQPAWGYGLWMGMVVELSKYFVNTGITWGGKTAIDIYDLMSYFREWWNNYGGLMEPGGVGTSILGDYCKSFGMFIPPIYLTDYPAWPPQAPPTGWPVGTPFGGFTRKCERTITSLADFGVEGELARFVVSSSPQQDDGQGPEADGMGGLVYFSFDDVTQQPAPTSFPHPTTPSTDAKYSQMIMLYHAGVWTVNSDQTVEPDILTFYGLPKWGDIFGPWILNELKTAINLLTTSIERITPGAADGVVNFTTQPTIYAGYEMTGIFWDYGAPAVGYTGSALGSHNEGFGQSPAAYGSGGTEAGAIANYNSWAASNYGGNEDIWGNTCYSWTWIQVDGSGSEYFECASAAIELFLFHWANSKSRKVTFYVNTYNAAFNSRHTTDVLFSQWTWQDDSGLSLSTSTYTSPVGHAYSGVIQQIKQVTSSDDHVSGGFVGSFATWLPSWPSTPTGVGTDYARFQGMAAQPMDATVDWMPSFQYYAGTSLV